MARQINSKADLEEFIKDSGIGRRTAKKLRDAFDKPAGAKRGSSTGHGSPDPKRARISTM